MLPVTVQFIVAMLAYALNERMARRLEYLQEEVRVLKEARQTATAQRRIPLTDEQRRRLASKGKALTPAERGVLPDSEAVHHPGLVPEARCPEVRQLPSSGAWQAAEGEPNPAAHCPHRGCESRRSPGTENRRNPGSPG